MKKLLLSILLFLTTNANATQIIYGTTYAPNGQVTSVNLNGNFNNVSSIVNGKLDNTNADTTNGYRFYQTVSVLPSSGNQGSVYFLTSDNSLNFDTGSSFSKSVTTINPVAGDLIQYSGTAWNRIPIGANNTLLSSNGSTSSYGFTVGTSANNIVQLDSSDKLPALNGSQLTNIGTNITGAFGSWASATINSPTQATSDGFLVIVGNANGTLTIKTDSANPPTTVRINLGISTGTPSAVCPVKKNDYYLTTNAASGYFIPLGS